MTVETPPSPQKQQSLPAGKPSGFNAALVRKSTLVYGTMAAIGITGMRYGHRNLASAFAIPTSAAEVGRLLAVGILSCGLLLTLSYFFEDWFESYRELKANIMKFLGPVSISSALYLSAITAVGEEVFFRGTIQPAVGLVLASALFGLLHMGTDAAISAWSLWALIAGLVLGWSFQQTSSLWPAVIAHFSVNATAILSLRRSFRRYSKAGSALRETMKTSRTGPGAPVDKQHDADA